MFENKENLGLQEFKTAFEIMEQEKDDEPMGWQIELVKLLDGEPHPSDVMWIVGNESNGKTWISRWYERNGNKETALITNAESRVLQYTAEANDPVVIVDLSRHAFQKVDYAALSMLKTGQWYNGAVGRPFKNPHVVVMSNYPPNYDDKHNLLYYV